MSETNREDHSARPVPYNLVEVGLDILRASQAEEACARLTGHLEEIFPGCQVSILLADPEGKRIALLMEEGYAIEVPENASDALYQGITGQVFKTGQVNVAAGEGSFTGQRLILPLRCKSKVIGVLNLLDSEGRYSLESGPVELAAALAYYAAAAIETSRLYQAEQERLRVEAALITAERKLSAGLKPSELPARILEEMAEVVPYERGSFLLKEGESLRIAAQSGFPIDERTQKLTIPLREGDVYKQIESTCLPVLIDDVTQEPGWKQVEWLPLNLSWLGLPLFSKDRVVGMVSLTRKERGDFSQEDVLLASTFALQAAVALENAALYEEITRFNQQLEQMVEQRTEELRQALTKLERMDKNKSDFINVAAHELRTPLTIMRGYLQMLQSDAVVKSNPLLLQALEGLLRGTDRLQAIFGSMLDVAKIDSQLLELQPEMVAMSTIIRRVQSDFNAALLERKLTLDLVDLEGLPLVKGDANLLLKVFQNVVINAIKYTPDGGTITISGRRVQDEQCGDCLEMIVQDTGIGIDPDQRELIFEKFYSTGSVALHSSGTISFKGGGPGLGLAIVRGIVLAHKGRIWVESERYDEEACPGSCFHILLPATAI